MQGTKALLASKGVWGGIVALAAMVLQMFGYTIADEDLETLVVMVAQFAEVIGVLVAIYGRIAATKQIVKVTP